MKLWSDICLIVSACRPNIPNDLNLHQILQKLEGFFSISFVLPKIEDIYFYCPESQVYCHSKQSTYIAKTLLMVVQRQNRHFILHCLVALLIKPSSLEAIPD